MSNELVLVTGGSGFIAAECIVQLLNAGYRVRTTVRSLTREPEVRQMLTVGGAEHGDKLAFFAADLTSDAGWSEAIAGCDYVLHVASPFPPASPKDENELIIPAREGALRVLRAARDAGVKRVVLTSSFAAIGYGHPQSDKPFTEQDWTDVNARDVNTYAKSKTLAERAAWDFIAREGGALELAVVNPVGVVGPVLGPDLSTSIVIVKRLLDGAVPGIPHLGYNLVDVRDVADAHLRAMTNPAAKGQRFLATAGYMTVKQIAEDLRSHLGSDAARVPTRMIPDAMLRLAGLFDPAVRQTVPDLGKVRIASGEQAKRVLGLTPRPAADAIIATAESLRQLGLLANSNKA